MISIQRNAAVCGEGRRKDSTSAALGISSSLRSVAPFAGALIFFLLVFSVPRLQAKPNSSPAPPKPSIGRDVFASVVRGGTCELDLQGIVMPGDRVEFKVSKPPRHGTLEGPRRLDSERVSYTYRNNGEKSVADDRVEFRLKTGPANAWGTLTARISIMEQQPRLAVAGGPLDFGAVLIGGNRVLNLKIRNEGGGRLSGHAVVGEPWSAAGSAEFELTDEQPRDFGVVFSPAGPGKFEGLIEFQTGSNPLPVVKLSGEGVYRFQVAERFTIEKQTDGGWLEIVNLGSEELPLGVAAPKPLVCDQKIVIPAGESAQLKVGVQDGIYTENSVNLSLEDGPAVRTVRVDLPPPPVRLEWENAPQFQAGSFPLRSRPELPIGLTNAGVRNATVRIVTRKEDGLEFPQADSFEIQPGETATVKALWNLPEKIGEARAVITAWQDGFATDLELIAQVEPERSAILPGVKTKINGPASPASAANSRLKSMSESMSGAQFKRKEMSGGTIKDSSGLSDLSAQVVLENGIASAILTWKYKGPKPVKFRIERMVVERVSLASGQVFQKRLEVPDQLPATPVTEKWIPIEESTSNLRCLDGTAWEARLPGLPTGWSAVRLVMTMPDTDPWATRPIPLEVGTLPRPPWMNWAMAGVVLFAVFVLRGRIAGWLGIFIRR